MNRHPQAMPEAEILSTANALLREHGMGGLPVRVNQRLTRTYGQVKFSRATRAPSVLEISGPLSRANDRWRTLETIKHEVAHAIAPYGAGHGPEWKAACAIVGAQPRRCYDMTDTNGVGRYVATCNGCGDTVASRTRAPKGTGYWHRNACGCGPARGRRPITFHDRATLTVKESTMATAKHYRYVVTDPVGIEHTDTRARKQDAIKAAKKTALKEGGVRWIVYTPTGDVAEEWHADTPQSKRPAPAPADPPAPEPADDAPTAAAPPAPDKAYRRDRIPAGATEHTCETCGHTLPVTKFPTTRDKSRLTECRGCRDARRK